MSCRINPKTNRCGSSKKHTQTPEKCTKNKKGNCVKKKTNAKSKAGGAAKPKQNKSKAGGATKPQNNPANKLKLAKIKTIITAHKKQLDAAYKQLTKSIHLYTTDEKYNALIDQLNGDLDNLVDLMEIL